MTETQHQRTQLAWSRTALSLSVVGLVEVRLLLGSAPTTAMWTLGLILIVVMVTAILAAMRLRTDWDALASGKTSSGGRAPFLVAGVAVAVGVLGIVAVATS